MLEQLLPHTVACAQRNPTYGDPQSLFPDEREAVQRAVAKRQREFAAGRSAARQALQALGIAPRALLVGAAREPLWPEGVVGAITHCGTHCAAAVAKSEQWRGLGVDIEIDEALDSDVLALVCTLRERRAIAERASWPTHSDKIIFSAKECVYKVYYPLTRAYLDFLDAEVELFPEEGRFTATLLVGPPVYGQHLAQLQGRYALAHGYIFTALALPAQPSRLSV